MKADVACEVLPSSPCKRCKSKKVGCSLMPQNPTTGKTNRHAMTKSELWEYCCNLVKKGKQPARNSPDAGEPEGSGLAPSPSLLAPLAGLGTLTLDSGSSSAANTPVDSPAASLQQALPECPAPAPSAPSTCNTSKSSADKSPSKSL